MELDASVRLHGGKRALVERVRNESTELGVQSLSWAPTSLAAVALARAGIRSGFSKPLDQLLDSLPLESLNAVALHAPTLRSGKLVELLPQWRFDSDAEPRDISFVWLPELSRSKQLRGFVTYFTQKFGKPPYWDL